VTELKGNKLIFRYDKSTKLLNDYIKINEKRDLLMQNRSNILINFNNNINSFLHKN